MTDTQDALAFLAEITARFEQRAEQIKKDCQVFVAQIEQDKKELEKMKKELA